MLQVSFGCFKSLFRSLANGGGCFKFLLGPKGPNNAIRVKSFMGPKGPNNGIRVKSLMGPKGPKSSIRARLAVVFAYTYCGCFLHRFYLII